MPQVISLYEGGSGPVQGGATTMFQSTNPAANPVTGYADHQRRRSYQVTRKLNFNGGGPQGGLDVPTKRADNEWYNAFLANGGVDFAVGDIIHLILLPKNTRVEFVYAQVLKASKDAGLTFDLVLSTADGDDTAIVGMTGLGAVDAEPKTTARLDTDVDPDDGPASFISAKITAVPGESAAVLAGLNVMVSAEVVDWGQFDFNGNG